jgi:hypothetical protein
MQKTELNPSFFRQAAPVGMCGLEQAKDPDDIGLDKILGAVDGAINVAFGGEIDAGGWPVFREQPLDQFGVGEIAGVGQFPGAPALDIRDRTSQSLSRTRARRVDLLRRPGPPCGPANGAGPQWLDASRGSATRDYAPSLRSPWRAAIEVDDARSAGLRQPVEHEVCADETCPPVTSTALFMALPRCSIDDIPLTSNPAVFEPFRAQVRRVVLVATVKNDGLPQKLLDLVEIRMSERLPFRE